MKLYSLGRGKMPQCSRILTHELETWSLSSPVSSPEHRPGSPGGWASLSIAEQASVVKTANRQWLGQWSLCASSILEIPSDSKPRWLFFLSSFSFFTVPPPQTTVALVRDGPDSFACRPIRGKRKPTCGCFCVPMNVRSWQQRELADLGAGKTQQCIESVVARCSGRDKNPHPEERPDPHEESRVYGRPAYISENS